jgi:hypothetical protein
LKENGYGIYAHDVTAGEHLRDYFGIGQ